MNPREAQRVIESLRKGLPPDGHVRRFTVGRSNEIVELTQRLQSRDGGVLLLHANYGSGKTHLLRFVREEALEQGYVVSLVSLDAQGAVRFNRMDQVLAAICRGLETPGSPHRGIRGLFDLVQARASRETASGFWTDLTSNGAWDYSDVLDSPVLFVALRAWCTGDRESQDLVEDWLSQPWSYRTQRKKLYERLVERLRRYFRESRPEWKFYSDGVLLFHPQGYSQCWAALRDLHRLSVECGLSGLIILFDEYEDVITNLRNIAHQEAAFWNLFQFYSGKQFPGMSFYAVTPEFASKCKSLLLAKDRYDFDYDLFDRLPTFRMSPLAADDLLELGSTILPVHGAAYGWTPASRMTDGDFDRIVRQAARDPIEDRTRQAIRRVVMYLDDLLQAVE